MFKNQVLLCREHNSEKSTDYPYTKITIKLALKYIQNNERNSENRNNYYYK